MSFLRVVDILQSSIGPTLEFDNGIIKRSTKPTTTQSRKSDPVNDSAGVWDLHNILWGGKRKKRTEAGRK